MDDLIVGMFLEFFSGGSILRPKGTAERLAAG
jgi:hypothetical protein